MKRRITLVIFGHCYSMKNSKIFGRFKHPKARKFEQDFMIQVRPEHRQELGRKGQPLRATVRAFYPSFRQDLDCELVFDLLQKSHVVLNDRYIREKHTYAEVDTKNPRVEIEIEEV